MDCFCCGKNETYVNRNGYELWYNNYDLDNNKICGKCYGKYFTKRKFKNKDDFYKYLSIKLKNKPAWNKGISCSEQTKKKIAKANKGKKAWNKGIIVFSRSNPPPMLGKEHSLGLQVETISLLIKKHLSITDHF